MTSHPRATIEAQPLPPIVYAGISAVGLLFSVGLLVLFVRYSADLMRNGIGKAFFYVLLIPLGFSAAAFLFGAMRSYGRYRGKVVSGVLELGGPIVVAALTVVGGIYTIRSESPRPPFFVKLKFTDQNGATVSQGDVTLELRNATIPGKVSDGAVTFYEIPFEFFMKTAAVRFNSVEFQGASTVTLNNEIDPPIIKLQRRTVAIVPPVAIPITYDTVAETVESKEAAGWGTNWSPPQVACTTDKPEGWTIVRVYDFHLISSTERSECGKWTTCNGGENDTPRRACRAITVQGHNENRYDGWGKAVAVFHVDWKHPRQ